jgi:hypothetical protein
MLRKCIAWGVAAVVLASTGSVLAGESCETFTERVPDEYGGGCFTYTICCNGSNCVVKDQVDHGPGGTC